MLLKLKLFIPATRNLEKPGNSKGKEMKKAISAIVIALLLTSMLLLSLNIRLARAPATIIVPDDFSTIQAAINAASDGDTIFVRNGTYYGNVIVNKTLSLDGESRDSTILDGNNSGTVVTIVQDDVSFMNFTVKDSGSLDWDTGIYVTSFNNNISDNLVTDNNNGVHLMGGNNSLRGNILTNNTYNLGVWGDSISGFEQNIDTSNMIEGKHVYFLVNQKDIVIPSNAGYVGIVNSFNISIMNLDLEKNGEGVLLAFSSGCSIIKTTTSNNRLGFYLFGSQENVVSGNVLTGNGVGVYLDLSESNTLSLNDIGYSGSAYPGSGVELHWSSDNTIENNHVTNVSSTGIGVWGNPGQDNEIIGNKVLDCGLGLVIGNLATRDLVTDNSIMNCNEGIDIESCSYNAFYHNSFINNTVQFYSEHSSENNTWNNGYPSGGNYWSDYTGTDMYSGPYQNVTGSDGIGDTPYVIDSNNIDHYPLMQPWTGSMRFHDVAVINVTSNCTWVFQGFSANINVTILNRGDFGENVNATLYYNATSGDAIGTQNITLLAGENETLAFVWDTKGLPYNQNYTITAVATIPLDVNLTDNTLATRPITVRILGDINGDGRVDGRDITIAARAFGTRPGDPRWNLDADINGDGKVDGRDLVMIARNFGK